MIPSISEVSLSRLSEFVATEMGLHLPRERWSDLERGIRSAAREFGFKDAEPCIDWLVSSPLARNQIEILASHLTVGETYFFREQKSFEILEEHLFPELIRTRRRGEQSLRIWSAGCCTGEEPYSIAMLLSKMIPDLKDWNITILATDLNPRSLQKASDGVYGEWSFRCTPQGVREKYFRLTQESRWAILPHIKEMVTFDYLNLAEDAYPSLLNYTNAMDVIFCRNVLMYFTPDGAKNTVQNLFRALVNGGWLLVSPSETSHVLFSQFVSVNFPGATLYRKDNHQPQMVEVFPSGSEDERKVSFPPILDFISESDSAVGPPDQLQEPLPSDAKCRNIAKPQPASFGEALTLYEQGRYEEAAERTAILLSQGRDDAKAMALLARVYANQGRLSEALEWCKKAIEADKLNAGYYYLRATILQEQGSFGEARMSLKRALYLDQNFVLAHFALGNLTLREGKLEESGKHFENARSILSSFRQEEILPESEGITAGRLLEIITVHRDHGSWAEDQG
jgi:chemotaxis protein methyltransferase CheR